jgi:hypothetical protein
MQQVLPDRCIELVPVLDGDGIVAPRSAPLFDLPDAWRRWLELARLGAGVLDGPVLLDHALDQIRPLPARCCVDLDQRSEMSRQVVAHMCDSFCHPCRRHFAVN